jgi:hypothetical protein
VKIEASIHAPFPSAMSSCADIAFGSLFFRIQSDTTVQFLFSTTRFEERSRSSPAALFPANTRQRKKKPTVTPPPCLMGIIRDA